MAGMRQGMVVTGLWALLAAAVAGPGQPPPSPLSGWSRLVLQGEKLWIAAATSSIERWPLDRTHPAPLVRVTSDLRLFGNPRGSHRSWSELDPAGRSLVRWVEAEPPRKSRTAALDAGGSVLVRRFRWSSSAAENSPERWIPRDHKQIPPPAPESPAGSCLGPVDPYSLLARLDCLAEGKENRLVLLTKDGWSYLTARRGTVENRRRSLKDLDTGQTRTVELEVVRVDLEARDRRAGAHVLGMTGPVTLWLDAQSGALVEIEGTFNNVPGKTRMTLSAFSRTAAPRPALPWPASGQP